MGEKKLGPASYRLAKVVQLHPDREGVVRTVTISMRNRRGGGTQVEEGGFMAVQRLAVILPVEEKWNEGLAYN